ncbi:hypothetical protein C2E23DRAFT_869396 [Lenzites betulinus]|nr:hypothetical protein C2E23DRAFT_869396 [Lenzites betulinus]
MPLHDVLRQRLQPLTSAVTSNRIFLYAVFSLFAVAATIANACRAHSNFYSVSIYLAKSSRSVLVLANFGFLCALLSGRIFQAIFFGPLQPREVERLYDQTWMFVTESLLAFTIFRDEFDVPFLLMFGFLLFVKCFHWLMADRVESVNGPNALPWPPTLFHVRINALFGVLWAIDLTMFAFAVESTLTNGVGGMVLFASEYAILLASALNAMMRYALSILDLRRARTRGGENAPPWENKSMYIFYIELLTDFLKLTTYMTFFMIILTFYGLPLNIIRDVFVTARSFITRLRALVRYHNATRDMDRRYPDATEAELVDMSDRTCIICREEMHSRAAPAQAQQEPAAAANGDAQQQPPQPPADGPNMTPKKLPCGHIFHFQCLRSWLERQQSCPTCRRTVLDNNPPQNTPQAPGQGQPGAARPRPGAAPVPGAAPGGAVAGNGPLGWVGRFLGLPQAPALNGQFPGAQARVPFQQGMPPPNHQPAWEEPGAGLQPPPPGHIPGPPPGVFYDPAQGWQLQPFQPPPPMQQPPMLYGFYGPGQVWQPWGNPQLYAQQPPAHAQPQPAAPLEAPSLAQPAQLPLPPSVPAPTGEAATPQSADSQAPTPTPTTSAAEPPAAEGETLEARRAAALAALRRLNQSAVSPSAQTPEATSGASSELGIAPPAPAETSAPIPTPTTTPAAPAEPSSSTSVPLAGPHPPNSHSNPALPSLIPLYDPSTVTPMRVANPNPYLAPYGNYYRAPGVPSSSARPAGVRPSSSSQQAAAAAAAAQAHVPRSARAGPGGARTPLGQLPPTLTEEQLARLDRLTREAIDERLRVLEGVSGAIFRCMEELTRVRSVMGPAVRRTGAGQAQAGPSSTRAGDASTDATASTSTATPTTTTATTSGEPRMMHTTLATLTPDGAIMNAARAGDVDEEAAKDVVPEPSSGSATPSENGSIQCDAGEATGAALDASTREGEEAE